MKKFLTLLALLALTVHSFAAGRRIELLFLGDQGHCHVMRGLLKVQP